MTISHDGHDSTQIGKENTQLAKIDTSWTGRIEYLSCCLQERRDRQIIHKPKTTWACITQGHTVHFTQGQTDVSIIPEAVCCRPSTAVSDKIYTLIKVQASLSHGLFSYVSSVCLSTTSLCLSSAYLHICLPASLCVCLSNYFSVCLLVCPIACLFCIYLPAWLSSCLPICLSAYFIPACLPSYVSVFVYISLSISLFAGLTLL